VFSGARLHDVLHHLGDSGNGATDQVSRDERLDRLSLLRHGPAVAVPRAAAINQAADAVAPLNVELLGHFLTEPHVSPQLQTLQDETTDVEDVVEDRHGREEASNAHEDGGEGESQTDPDVELGGAAAPRRVAFLHLEQVHVLLHGHARAPAGLAAGAALVAGLAGQPRERRPFLDFFRHRPRVSGLNGGGDASSNSSDCLGHLE